MFLVGVFNCVVPWEVFLRDPGCGEVILLVGYVGDFCILVVQGDVVCVFCFHLGCFGMLACLFRVPLVKVAGCVFAVIVRVIYGENA